MAKFLSAVSRSERNLGGENTVKQSGNTMSKITYCLFSRAWGRDIIKLLQMSVGLRLPALGIPHISPKAYNKSQVN